MPENQGFWVGAGDTLARRFHRTIRGVVLSWGRGPSQRGQISLTPGFSSFGRLPGSVMLSR